MSTDAEVERPKSFNRFHFWATAYCAVAVVGGTWLGWSTQSAMAFVIIGNVWWFGGELVVEMRRLTARR